MKAILVSATALSLATAVAAAPATGTVTLNGQKVVMSHAVALLHDNVEGTFREPLVIVISDRPVPPAALAGMAAFGVHELARAGKVRGLMVRLDPARPEQASFVLLDKPADERTSLGFASVQGDSPVITGLSVKAGSVAGKLVREESGQPPAAYAAAVTFDAVRVPEPAVVADLKGAAMKTSPVWKLATNYVEAVGRGDVKAVQAIAAPAMRQQIDAMIAASGEAAVSTRLKADGPNQKRMLAQFKRLVDRGSSATLIVEPDWTLAATKVDGEWRIGN